MFVKCCGKSQTVEYLFNQFRKGGRAPGAYKARFAAWLSYASYSEDI